MLRNLRSFLVVVCLLSTGIIFAQTGVGTLKGTVKDKATGEPLPFANVVVMSGDNQVGGSATDFDGKYTIKPLSPGKYDVKVVFVGYNPSVISGVIVQGDKISFQDINLESGVNLEEVIVIDYVQPLINRDGGSSGGTVSRGDIDKMAARSATAVASTVGGISSAGQADGDISVRGARSENTFYYIDGIKVRGEPQLPKSAFEEVSIITGGIPASYGDATGGIISITTRGASSEFFGGIDLLSSGFKAGDNIVGLDAYGRTQLEGYLSGPLLWKKNDAGEKVSPLMGFFLSGNFRKFEDPRPSVNGHWYLNDEAQAELEENPQFFVATDNGFAPRLSSEQLTMDMFVNEKAARNSDQLGVSLTTKLDFNLSENVVLSFGGTGDYRDNNDFLQNGYTTTTSLASIGGASRLGSLLNYNNNANTEQTQWRAFGRVTQRFPSGEDSKIKNAFYTVSVDYNQSNRETKDRSHGEDFFNYGHIGKFSQTREATYAYNQDTDQFVQSGDSVLVTSFTPGTANPILAGITQDYMDAALSFTEGVDLANDVRVNALANGDVFNRAYGLWTNVGTPSNFYIKNDNRQTRLTLNGSADLGDHAMSLGIEFEQRTDRSYSLAPVGIWERMRNLANSHIDVIDPDSGVLLSSSDPNHPGGDQIGDAFVTVFDPLVNSDIQTTFDRNLRISLGLDPDGDDFINVDELGPEVFNLDMFSSEDLLLNGANLVNYNGYDSRGNVLSTEPSIDDYFNDTDEFGNNTRLIGAFKPVYLAGYIMDKFAFDDIIFNVGLRVDRFDANQKVLRDEYIVGDFYTAGNVPDDLNPTLLDDLNNRPANIGDDYAVYVNSDQDPSTVIGYRIGDDWFDREGTSVNPTVLQVGVSSYPLLSDESGYRVQSGLTAEAFEDYTPSWNVMPRVAFSFPISDEAVFFAHYDILTQRPTTGVRLELMDYQFIQAQNAVINNASLQPTKTVDYELGFQQVLSRSSSLKLSAFYRDMRDMIQVRSLVGAWPEDYVTFRNIDFGTVKGLTIAYDLRRTGNMRLNANYTLQFASGTGSNSTSGLNLANSGQANLQSINPLNFDQRHAINLTMDYRYGSGSDYNGPVWFGKQVFANTGMNVITNLGSGTPYSATRVARSIRNGQNAGGLEGTINGSRLQSTFTVDLQLDKNIDLKFGKNKETDKAKTANLNIYLLVNNLLNRKNVRGVYSFTGSPDDDGYLATAEAQQEVNGAPNPDSFTDLYNLRLDNPFNFATARTISLGVKMDF